MATPPDVEGVAIWAEDFDRSVIPSKIGVYCFYDPQTLIPEYIGSGCSIHASSSGLWRRILQYCGGRGVCKHDARIGQVVRDRRLLLKVWLASSSGDAKKYETDALARYKPSLNKVGTDDPASTVAREVAQFRKYNDESRAKWLGFYDPEIEKKCSQCKLPKKCSEYRRMNGYPFGVKRACKVCEKVRRKSKQRNAPSNFYVEAVRGSKEQVIPG